LLYLLINLFKIPQQVLHLLADGQRYTAPQLIEQLGISPLDLDLAIRTVTAYGIRLNPSAIYGYQLAERLELLDRDCILADLSGNTRQRLAQLEILEVIDSTNRYALEQPPMEGAFVCLAEYQTAGRGRQGRQWVSPYASGLCLSLKQRYDALNHSLAGISIATAVTVGQVLRALGAAEIGLKWPNDVVWRGRKLAGLLLESRNTKVCVPPSENRKFQNACDVVVGMGMNIKMPGVETAMIDQPWTDLQTVLGYSISRNQLAARLIEQGLQTLATYPQHGLAPFMRDWQSFDMIYGHPVTLKIPPVNQEGGAFSVTGIACGIDEEGALLLQVGNRKQRYVYGEVSVRFSG
jgi:BirA family biotin operon repressor/biotin-[acetyl-CoA-carboxylase] ligase